MARNPRQQATPADELERASQSLDRLIGEARLGIRSQRHFDTMEEQAQAIAARIVSAFRGPPTAAPLAIETRNGRTTALF